MEQTPRPTISFAIETPSSRPKRPESVMATPSQRHLDEILTPEPSDSEDGCLSENFERDRASVMKLIKKNKMGVAWETERLIDIVKSKGSSGIKLSALRQLMSVLDRYAPGETTARIWRQYQYDSAYKRHPQASSSPPGEKEPKVDDNAKNVANDVLAEAEETL